VIDQRNYKRVLALDIRPHRFGFVVLEGPTMLLDCGVKSFHSRPRPTKIPPSQKILTLLNDFFPSVIVVRDRERHVDTARILETVRRQAKQRRFTLKFISRKMIVKAFAVTGKNKHEVASVLAEQFLTLLSKLPPRRKCWQSEDYRMSMFDAAAAGVAYFRRGHPLRAVPSGLPKSGGRFCALAS
jgi:hypothetical protein